MKELKDQILKTFKDEGLEMAEDAAVKAVRVAFKTIRLLLPKASPLLGRIGATVLDLVEPKVFSLLDKIDGKDDPSY